MITRQLNPQAIIIEDAETDVRMIVWTGFLTGKSKVQIEEAVKRRVNKAKKDLKSKRLKEDAVKSLFKFATLLYFTMCRTFGTDGKAVQNTINYAMGKTKVIPKKIAKPIVGMKPDNYDMTFEIPSDGKDTYESQEMGVPNDTWMKDYMHQVERKTKELAEINALDPNDENNRNSLRNEAEIVVRQEYHEKQVSDFKEKGVKLVVCSAHQDCSDRCAPWQGKIYSLDGTSGKTEDGKKYQPLENATDIYYETKTTHRKYKNGLLGFNCRHRLYEYKTGMKIPTVDEETQKREDAINKKQRWYEREIRKARTNALMYKQQGNMKKYKYYRDRAIKLNKEYQEFSMKNGRAYYPDRCSIFD